MENYWSSRASKARQNGLDTPCPDAREVYLRVADHYHALEIWCAARSRGIKPKEGVRNAFGQNFV